MPIFNHCNVKMLQKSQEEYKTNMTNSTTLMHLYEISPTLFQLVTLFPSCELPIKEAFEKKAALQPSVLSEYAAFSVIAQLFGCTKIISHSDTTNCRCEYQHPHRPIVIKQYGGCQYLDGEIWNGESLIRRFEVKQKIARNMDNDLSVDTNGNLLIPNILQDKWQDYAPFINSINVWDWVNKGNIKLNDVESMRKIAHLYLMKYPNTDILIWGDNGLYLLSAENYFQHSNTKNSEIRPFGKNARKAYSIDKLNFYIKQKCGNVTNNIITLPSSTVEYKKGRGTTEITRCVINSAFFVRIQDVTINGDTVCFAYDKVQEKRPNISIHMTFEEM